MLPRRNNPYLPCGEGSEWVLSSYGHMAVLHEEGPLSLARKILIATTVALGIFHICAVMWLYWKHCRDREGVPEYSAWSRSALFWFLLAAIGRYYHFIDNHTQPAAYHDGDIIYCATIVADTDAFLPFQLIHVIVGLYAVNNIFRDKCVNKASYHAILAFGAISCVGFLHYTIEPVTFFALPQQVSILGEAVTGLLLIYWGSTEYDKYTISANGFDALTAEDRQFGESDETDPLKPSNTIPSELVSDNNHHPDYSLRATTITPSIRRRSKERIT